MDSDSTDRKRARTNSGHNNSRKHRRADSDEGEGGNASVNRGQRNHVQTEQRRRDRIKEGFDSLRNLIPHREGVDKAGFLQQAVDYVQNVHQVVRDVLKTGLQRHMSQELQIRLQSLIPHQTPIVIVNSLPDPGLVPVQQPNLEGSLHSVSHGLAQSHGITTHVTSIHSLLPRQHASQPHLLQPGFQQQSTQDFSMLSSGVLPQSSVDAVPSMMPGGVTLSHSQAVLMDALRSTHGSHAATLALQSAGHRPTAAAVAPAVPAAATAPAGAAAGAPASAADHKQLGQILQMLQGQAVPGQAAALAQRSGDGSQHASQHGSTHAQGGLLQGILGAPALRHIDPNQAGRVYAGNAMCAGTEGSVHGQHTAAVQQAISEHVSAMPDLAPQLSIPSAVAGGALPQIESGNGV